MLSPVYTVARRPSPTSFGCVERERAPSLPPYLCIFLCFVARNCMYEVLQTDQQQIVGSELTDGRQGTGHEPPQAASPGQPVTSNVKANRETLLFPGSHDGLKSCHAGQRAARYPCYAACEARATAYAALRPGTEIPHGRTNSSSWSPSRFPLPVSRFLPAYIGGRSRSYTQFPFTRPEIDGSRPYSTTAAPSGAESGPEPSFPLNLGYYAMCRGPRWKETWGGLSVL